MSPYQLQQELVVTHLQLESQSTQTLSLEAALLSRPELPPDASETVGEEVEKEWVGKLEEDVKKRKEKEAWAAELVRQLDKEKKLRIKLEEERRALASFVSKIDSLGLGLSALSSKLKPAKPTPGGASAAFAERQQSRAANVAPAITEDAESSPIRIDSSSMKAQPSQERSDPSSRL